MGITIFDLTERQSYFFISGIWMLLNTIPMFIVLLKNLHPAPLFTYLTTLIYNLGIPLLFIDYRICIVFVSFFIFLFVIPFDYCCCQTSFQGNHIVARESFCGKMDKDTFMNILKRNRSIPPVILVNVEAYHYETHYMHRTTTDSHGHTHHHTEAIIRKVVTWYCTRDLNYTSWEEEGNPIRMTDVPILHCICESSFLLDDSAKYALSELRNQMLWEASFYDLYQSSSISFDIPNFKVSLSGCISEEIPCVYSFYTSIIGNILWILFSLCGLQTLFEVPWCSYGERMRMRLRLKKAVSMNPKYRCGLNILDETAAQTTFRTDFSLHQNNLSNMPPPPY
jgi:hypothetical protein